MESKGKYHLQNAAGKREENISYVSLRNEISITDLIRIYYYVLYPNLSYAGEKHNFYEFFICLSGKVRPVISEKEYLLNENQFIICRPNEFHSHNPLDSVVSSVSISFAATGLDDGVLCDKVGTLSKDELNLVSIFINEYVNNFEVQGDYTEPRISRIRLENEYAYKQVLKCVLETLLVYASRHFLHDEAKHEIEIVPKTNANPVMVYIQEHYAEKLTLQELADHFGYSVGHLCRSFKEKTGETVINHILQVRLSQAMKLFGNKDLTIEEIAQKVGFSDVQYFTKAFKKYVGITPGKYRSRIAESKAFHAQDIPYDLVKNL